MIANREAIYQALFNVVSSVEGFVTVSRRLKHWDDVDISQQPALFTAQKNEHQKTQKGLPTQHTLGMDIYLYAKTGEDETVSPATILNPLVDAVEAMLKPSPALGYFPLIVDGQTISHCWIDGEIQTDEGVLGSQAVAIIPVRILAV